MTLRKPAEVGRAGENAAEKIRQCGPENGLAAVRPVRGQRINPFEPAARPVAGFIVERTRRQAVRRGSPDQIAWLSTA